MKNSGIIIEKNKDILDLLDKQKEIVKKLMVLSETEEFLESGNSQELFGQVVGVDNVEEAKKSSNGKFFVRIKRFFGKNGK